MGSNKAVTKQNSSFLKNCTCILNRDHACIRIWRRLPRRMCRRRLCRFHPSLGFLCRDRTIKDRREGLDREHLGELLTAGLEFKLPVGRMILLICSIDSRSGLRPPWQQKIFSSIIAARGRQLKQSVNVFQSYRTSWKRFGALKTYLDVIPTFAFVIETVDSVDRGALVIASEKEEVLGISYTS